MCALSWSNFATSCSCPMKLLHYVSQAPHTNICNSIMHKDLQNAAISLNESNSWRRLTTKDQKWLQTWFQTPPVYLVPRTIYFNKKAARATSKKFRRVTSVKSPRNNGQQNCARRFLLEILVRGTRYEVARAGLVH